MDNVQINKSINPEYTYSMHQNLWEIDYPVRHKNLVFCYVLLLHKASQFHSANQYKNTLNYVRVSYITFTKTTDIVELFLSNLA